MSAETSSSSAVTPSADDPCVLQVPPEWPPEVAELYDPVRELGRGGFASVLLARLKQSQDCHAIKVVGSKIPTRQEQGYARRELEILAELDHPNIMHLIHHWEPPVETHTCVAVMALSYAPGPTLDKLLRYGKLSLRFSRVVAAQLVDAIAYLHGRAVVHRDCKPDNIVVTGASDDQDDIWDDDVVVGAKQATDDAADWKALRQRWHVTLVDFGFARALTPEDLNKQPPPSSTRSGEDLLDQSTRSNRSLSRSMSRHFTRRMSALGNRTYAAPEIILGVKDQPISNSSRHPMDITKTLSQHVSFYGLLADAYSVGNTIKHMLTGVVPTEDVNDAIALQNNPLAVLCRLLCSGGGSSKRKVQYRRFSAIPNEVVRLIRGLTDPDPQQRLSVRSARLYPWIDGVLDEHVTVKAREPNFLSFVRHPGEETAVEET